MQYETLGFCLLQITLSVPERLTCMHGLKHLAAFVCPAHEEDLISAAWQLGLFLLLALPPSSAPMHARTRASSPSGHRRKVVDAVVFGEGASFNERAATPCSMEWNEPL